MKHIGEFQQESVILLELVTMNDKNEGISTDIPVSARIQYSERNGLQEVDNVKLETMADTARHSLRYVIPAHFSVGDYIINYHIVINGKSYYTQEKFVVESGTFLVQEDFLELEEEVSDEAASEVMGHLMPSDFGIALQGSPIIEGNKLTLTLQDPMKYNQTYRVVLKKGIASLSGAKLAGDRTVTFTSEYKPLFATPTEMHTVLKESYKYFTLHDIYSALRDAGEKAMQLKGNVADANNSRYREIRETDTSLFPTQKYVLYEAAKSLLNSMMIKILHGSDEETGTGIGMMNQSGGSVTLGDFSVSDKSSSSTGVGGSGGDSEETPLRKLKTLIDQNESELVFWRDSMMGRNRRGYARPSSGSFKTSAGSPEGRDF